MWVVGIVGYIVTPNGLRSFGTVWASHLSVDFMRRLYKNWYRAQKKAFSKRLKLNEEERKKYMDKELGKIRNYCTVIRVIAHSQMSKLHLRQKKISYYGNSS